MLGDQLDSKVSALVHLDKARDAVVMFEVAEESTHVPSNKQRTALFLAAMRHFALELHRDGHRVHYVSLDDSDNSQALGSELQRALRTLEPEFLVCTQPGEWRVHQDVERAAMQAGAPLEVLPDEHFLTSAAAFAEWMAGRKQPVMEHFYRWQRRRLGILVAPDGAPVGGEWNYDQQNRGSFRQPPRLRAPYAPRADAITHEVLALVERRFAGNPGLLARFRWPVTRAQARKALDDFIQHRLPHFGTYQDAMWSGEPFLYHSLLSAALNLKLLNPRECVAAALAAYESGAAPLPCVEGFVRQIIGWREFIHGIYWHAGPGYRQRNGLDQHGSLPDFYWTGQTDMICLRECIGQVLECGYGHHIQRLMVTGNFALIAGVNPRRISDWYLSMFVDAVDWVTLPNTLGMVMHADGGVVGTKPYAASGRYIERMSNHCKNCRFDPGKRTGTEACPFTTFYWDFLIRNLQRFRGNRRMSMILKHVDRLTDDERAAIAAQAQKLRQEFGIHSKAAPG
ncbi:MAG: cryptochrome/photolyase family protein [Phycisphaerae bacterium]